MREPERRAVSFVAVLAVVAVGAALRFADLDASLWGDEISTYQRAKAPVGYCLSKLATPVHEILVHYSIQIADNEVFLRLPGVMAGLGTILLIYFVARSLGGAGAGFIASLLLATSTYHLFRCQEARYYTLMMLAGLLWVWLLVRCITCSGAGNWLVYVLTCFWGLLVHQFCAPFLITMNAGAGMWILVSSGFPTRRRRLLRLGALALCTALGATGVAVFFVVQGRSPMTLLSSTEHVEPATDTTAAARSPLEPQEVYRLSVGEYAGHVKELFNYRRPLGMAGLLLLVFGVCGLVAAFARHSSFAAIALAAFCLTPLPMLFVPVRHNYEERYFCILLPIGFVLVAVGMVRSLCLLASVCSAPATVGRIWRGGPSDSEPLPPRTKLLAGFFILLALSALAPSGVRSLQWYYAWQPEKDYKALAQSMAQTMTPNDVIYYVDPDNLGVWHFRTTPRVYYWKRFLKDSEAYLFAVKERRGPLDQSVLTALLAEFPESTIWFYALEGHTGQPGELLDQVCPEKRTFNGIVLWVLGEPTTNLLSGSGFENPVAATDPEIVQFVSGAEAYAGARALRIRLDKPASRRVGFRVNSPGYSAQCDVRNPSFEVWKNQVLVGWEVRAKSLALVRPSAEAHGGKIGLELKESPETVGVIQRLQTGLGPSHAIEVSAWGKAPEAKQLRLALAYLRGDQVQRKTAYYPGGNTWAPVTLRENVPSDTDWNSLAVEIVRDPGSPGSVFVDDVRVSIREIHDSLDPQKTYTLSLMLRYENLRSSYETSNLQDAASILLAFTRPDGKDQWIHMADFYGTRDWHPLAFEIKPGRDIPFNASWLLVSVALYGTGTIWIDNVQLEAKEHPTPFTEGTRPPHDEWLAQVFAAR